MANKTIEIIKSRVSCREYSPKKVSLNKLQIILDAGKSAPSAVNRQIADIVAVRKTSNIEKIRNLSQTLLNRDCMYGASTLVIVHAPRDNKFCIQDSTCIIENLMIAANALKIDSCWINQLDELLSAPEAKKLRKTLGIPEENMIVGSVSLGYRKEGTTIAVKAKDGINVVIK